MEPNKLLDGLSGIMCVKNEGYYLSACIDSCIDSLDELIVVYAPGDDNTELVLKQKKKQYPTKLACYLYPHGVLWFGMTRQEYDEAIKLPEDDPRLYSSMCNFALSKVKYKYVIKKIDADQLYFPSELKTWRDICANTQKVYFDFRCILGAIFDVYISFYRRISIRYNKPLLFLIPDFMFTLLGPSYIYFSKWKLTKKKTVISLSGLNVFYDGSLSVPFDGVNIHPPYNGEGDHIIFPLSSMTYFVRHSENRAINRDSYSVTEDFRHPYKISFGGICWFHLHANRKHCYEQVLYEKNTNPYHFVLVDDFVLMPYRKILKMMKGKIDIPYKKIYFSIVHKLFANIISNNLCHLIDYYKK